MIDYCCTFAEYLEKIRCENRYREFVVVSRDAGCVPVMYNKSLDKQVVTWCINDYLGMSQHHLVLAAAESALKLHGVGSGGTRNIGGNNEAIVKLEQSLASLHHKEQALVFTSGYIANDTSLATLAKIIPNIAFFSDELNHASIIQGINHSKAQKYIYKHLDYDDLERLLSAVPLTQPKIIIFESAYSMDGLFSPVENICMLAKKYNALTFIDEVHTVGLYGQGGAGFANMRNLDTQIDIIQGTLGKAYGVIGGYIAANSAIIEAIRLTASGFIFTTSLPPVITLAALASVEYLKISNKEREQHQLVVKKLKKALGDAGIKYLRNDSHIIPIIIGDAAKARECSRILISEYDIYVQHINFPTVARGTERLRITPSPYHTDDMIEHLVSSLVATFKYLGITNS